MQFLKIGVGARPVALWTDVGELKSALGHPFLARTVTSGAGGCPGARFRAFTAAAVARHSMLEHDGDFRSFVGIFKGDLYFNE